MRQSSVSSKILKSQNLRSWRAAAPCHRIASHAKASVSSQTEAFLRAQYTRPARKVRPRELIRLGCTIPSGGLLQYDDLNRAAPETPAGGCRSMLRSVYMKGHLEKRGLFGRILGQSWDTLGKRSKWQKNCRNLPHGRFRQTFSQGGGHGPPGKIFMQMGIAP